MRKALIIIDMLNDFVDKDGALYVQGAEKLVPNINKLIKWAADSTDSIMSYNLDNIIDIIFVCDAHDKNDAEFLQWPVHAIRGTAGAEINADIPTKFISRLCDMFYKQDLSMFSIDDLNITLKNSEIDELYITGVATDYCIVNAVLDSISKTGEAIPGAISRGYKVNIVVDAIASVDEITGVPRTKGKVAESLISMGAAGVKAVYTEDIIND